MTSRPQEIADLEDSLAEGIAAVMAAQEELEGLARPEDMADLFLDELNRLWADPEPLMLS